MAERRPRVVIIDDDALVRAGLRMMLGGPDGVDVVAEADDGDRAVEIVGKFRPDVVLMDIRMARVDGLAATRAVLQAYPSTQVLVLTTFDADDYVVEALRSGARGFVLKDTPPERLVAAVHEVAAGDHALSPSVTALLVGQVSSGAHGGDQRDERSRQARERLAVLTERELEVARAVARGASNAEISRELYLGVPTVKAHVSSILAKLGLANRVQIALLVHDATLIEGD
ncbi:response regulator transcription factor [Ornithinimicrobium humiphilum]|uniref:LuxR family two component transcriptional regulator n=1 Tax=Ornithinimicrobium humiphilum TaxID=125288 RepID=A0A543KK39_9MICO|nr:response regulator transcription factor [Ornithinimicrobium humiphilum]TQM95445.1 LuxR family two component transcriptional regulator [Ornithinimicrobium humiphilum]